MTEIKIKNNFIKFKIKIQYTYKEQPKMESKIMKQQI